VPPSVWDGDTHSLPRFKIHGVGGSLLLLEFTIRQQCVKFTMVRLNCALTIPERRLIYYVGARIYKKCPNRLGREISCALQVFSHQSPTMLCLGLGLPS
jgi:hypothetical protein